MASIREKVSIKAVVIGSVSDIVGSNIWGVILLMLVASRYNLASVPPNQLATTLTSIVRNDPLVFAANFVVGGLFSILGGYIAAHIAKRNELLNGALASFLCFAIGIFSIANGASHDPLWVQLFELPLSIALALLGGFLKLKQRSGSHLTGATSNVLP